MLSDTNANFTPGISERRAGTSTFQHSGIKNADSRTVSSSGIAASRTYDAFGNLVSSSGTWQGPFGYGGAFGYQEGGDYGLKLLGHRYLDSTTGTFLSRDRAKSGRNWFGYCANNPVKFADPSGLWEVGGFDFTGDTVGNGVMTGLAALGSAFSFGAFDGGAYKNQEGFGVAVGCGTVAREALVQAATMGASNAINAARAAKAAAAAARAAEAGTVAARGAEAVEAASGATKLAKVAAAGSDNAALAAKEAAAGMGVTPGATEGGIYVLRDKATGVVRYVGKTIDFARREGEWADILPNLRFEKFISVADDTEMAILEQHVMELVGGIKGGQLINKRNAVSRAVRGMMGIL